MFLIKSNSIVYLTLRKVITQGKVFDQIKYSFDRNANSLRTVVSIFKIIKVQNGLKNLCGAFEMAKNRYIFL